MADLTTTYLTLRLRHPFICGASPFADRTVTARQLEDGGAAALVMRSLFEEQITMAETGRIAQMDPLEPEFAARLADFPAPETYTLGPDEYLEQVRQLKAALGIPVIASLNGMTTQSWIAFAKNLRQAGADALELNMYRFVADPSRSSLVIESEIRDIVTALKGALGIPIAVKLPLFLTAPAHFARELARVGADGLIVFNRVYHPDIDVDRMTADPRVELSTSAELLPRLVWLRILRGQIRASLAVAGGVATPIDGIKAILAGADAVQIVSAIVRHGPSHFSTMRDGLSRWLDSKGFAAIGEARGLVGFSTEEDASLLERAAYIRTLQCGPTTWNLPAGQEEEPCDA